MNRPVKPAVIAMELTTPSVKLSYGPREIRAQDNDSHPAQTLARLRPTEGFGDSRLANRSGVGRHSRDTGVREAEHPPRGIERRGSAGASRAVRAQCPRQG